MSREKLIKRLEWYYPTERLHAFVTFPSVVALVLAFNAFVDVIFLVYGLLVCVFILYQGQHYWKLKLRRLKGERVEQRKNLRFFRNSKFANQILISLMPAVLLLQFFISNWELKAENLMGWAVFANAFAIIEHLNYYVRQISIDNKADLRYVLKQKRLKKASLAKDLDNDHI